MVSKRNWVFFKDKGKKAVEGECKIALWALFARFINFSMKSIWEVYIINVFDELINNCRSTISKIVMPFGNYWLNLKLHWQR